MSLGPVDLIVRRVNDDHEIEEVGLAIEHAEEARPRIPIFQNPKEIGELARGWWARMQRGVARLSLPKPRGPVEPRLRATIADPPALDPVPVSDLPANPARAGAYG